MLNSVSSVSFKQNVAPVSANVTKPEALEKQDIVPKNEERNISSEAADVIKANAMYKLDTTKLPEKTNEKSNEKVAEFKEYILAGSTPQEVRNVLADKKTAGRSFWGYKRAIRQLVEKSTNPDQTIANLNYLMNAEDGKLPANMISRMLLITEKVNSGDEKDSKRYSEKYGFEGGELTEDSYKKMSEVIMAETLFASVLFANSAHRQNMLNQQMLQQQQLLDQQMLHQQMFDQQMIQQNIINQQMMTPPPMGMGF